MSRLRQMRITRGALYLLVAEVAISLLYLISEESFRLQMAQWLVATSEGVWTEGRVWTLVTSPLLQPNFVSLLFHGLILWLFVPVLERWWGLKRFLLFALWTSLAGTITGTLVGLALPGVHPISGLDPFIYATIIGYGVLYADSQVRFFGVLPMTGRQLMIGIIAFVALFVIFGQAWANGAAFASAMVLAWLMTSGKWSPRLAYLRWKQRRIRRHLSVLRGGKGKKDDDDGRGGGGPWLN